MSPAMGEESVPSHPRSSSPAGERNENKDEVVDVSMEEEAVDVDPREHLSLVCRIGSFFVLLDLKSHMLGLTMPFIRDS